MSALQLFCSLVAIKMFKKLLHLKGHYTVIYKDRSKKVVFNFYKIRKSISLLKIRIKVVDIDIIQLFSSLSIIKILTIFALFKGALHRYFSKKEKNGF